MRAVRGARLARRGPGSISQDWRYGIAYNAALKLCTILLYAEGCRPPKGSLAPIRTLAALPHIIGPHRQADADYLDGCRQKRNTVEYDHALRCRSRRAARLLPQIAGRGERLAAGEASAAGTITPEVCSASSRCWLEPGKLLLR